MMKEVIMKKIGTIKLGAKRHAPELLLGGALIASTATIVTACRATLKAEKIKADFEKEKEEINNMINDVNEETAQQMCTKATFKYGLDMVKNYAVPVALYATTIGCVFASYKIQKNRQIALSTALLTTTTAYNTLLNRLKEGAAAGLTAKEVLDGTRVKRNVNLETGEITYEKYIDKFDGPYDIRYDNLSLTWSKDKFQNEATLRSEELHFNDILRLDGYVFLNDILGRLGLPKTKEGQVLGWIYDENSYIDFGMVDCAEIDGPGYDSNAYDLSFNVQGDILTKFNNK